MSSSSVVKASMKSKSRRLAKSLVPVVKKVSVNSSKLKSKKPGKVKFPSPKQVNSSPAKMNRRASKKQIIIKSCDLSSPQEEKRYGCYDVRTSGVNRPTSPGLQEVRETAESVCSFSIPVRKRKGRPRRDDAASKKRKTGEKSASVNEGSRTLSGDINTAIRLATSSAIGGTCTSEDKRSALAASDDIKASLTDANPTHQTPSQDVYVLASESKDVPSSEASSRNPEAGIDDVDYTVEMEYPEPSTPQQKMVRQLARRKQLEDMRMRETALAREERYQRRHGLCNFACPQPTIKSAKRVQWKSGNDLVKIFVYSAVSDSQDLVSDLVPS